MPTNTYTALDKVTVGTATPSITFSSIPQGYTDLVIVVSGLTASANAVGISLFVNGGTATGRSLTRLQGDGTSATSLRSTTDAVIGVMGNSEAANLIINVMNYSNNTTYKTILSRYNNLDAGDARVGAYVSLSQSTSAITSLTLSPAATDWAAGSTFSLYGIAASSVGAKATGGIISSDSQYYYHTFLASGTFTPTQSLSCDIVTVAGGASGAYNVGGGGGAGGVFVPTTQSLTATGYTVTVGAGGAAKTAAGLGNAGSNSQFASLTVASGGGGGNDTSGNGAAGGSGGGARQTYGTAGASNQSSTGGTGYGFAGAVGALTNSAGGGGGAGGAGTGGVTGTAGSGGVGLTSISWSGGTLQNALSVTGIGQLVSGTYYLAGGGGGGTALAATVGGPGGYGGGGVGGFASTAGNGIANTGGGGGGNYNANSGAGGSGIVIVRYAK